MRKLVFFLGSVCILALICVTLVLSGAVYDASHNTSIETYFFQPNNHSSQRIGVPVTPDALGESQMLNLLVNKFVSEYFYVVPDMQNVESRIKKGSTLSRITTPAVFDAWREDVAPEIREMASGGEYRTARLVAPVLRPGGESQYWLVQYELQTWYTPNDLTTLPTTTRGQMYVKISYNPGIREDIMRRGARGVHKLLKEGRDPVSFLKFGITEIVQE